MLELLLLNLLGFSPHSRLGQAQAKMLSHEKVRTANTDFQIQQEDGLWFGKDDDCDKEISIFHAMIVCVRKKGLFQR